MIIYILMSTLPESDRSQMACLGVRLQLKKLQIYGQWQTYEEGYTCQVGRWSLYKTKSTSQQNQSHTKNSEIQVYRKALHLMQVCKVSTKPISVSTKLISKSQQNQYKSHCKTNLINHYRNTSKQESIVSHAGL